VYVDRSWVHYAILSCYSIGGALYAIAVAYGQSWLRAATILVLASGFYFLISTGAIGLLMGRRLRVPRKLSFEVGYDSLLAGLALSYFEFLTRLFRQALPAVVSLLEVGLILGGTLLTSVQLLREWNRLPAKVLESADKSLRVMKEAGVEVPENIWLVIDPSIHYSALYYQSGDEQVIRIAPWAVNSQLHGGIDATMIHEMSHIYRRLSKHPSHTPEIWRPVWAKFVEKLSQKYQYKVLERAFLDIGEIFANDVALRVLQRSGLNSIESMEEEFQDQVLAKSAGSFRSSKKRWKTIGIIAHNSSAMAQITRHNLPDTEEKAKTRNDKLLQSLPHEAKFLHGYFYNLMVGLNEDITPEAYQEVLTQYLEKLVLAAENGFAEVERPPRNP